VLAWYNFKMKLDIDIIKVLKEILRESESNIGVRGFKGYGSSHAILNRTPTNLGKSEIRRVIDDNEACNRADLNHPDKVKVSRAFKESI